ALAHTVRQALNVHGPDRGVALRGGAAHAVALPQADGELLPVLRLAVGALGSGEPLLVRRLPSVRDAAVPRAGRAGRALALATRPHLLDLRVRAVRDALDRAHVLPQLQVWLHLAVPGGRRHR